MTHATRWYSCHGRNGYELRPGGGYALAVIEARQGQDPAEGLGRNDESANSFNPSISSGGKANG